MSTFVLRQRWWLPAILVAAWLSIALQPAFLAQLGLAYSHRWFLDSQALLAASDAAAAGLDLAQPNPLDPLDRTHVYSNAWLWLGNLGLTRDDNFGLGLAFVGAFLLAIVAILRPATLAGLLGVAALALAPPALFAVQRANNDLVVFALMAAAYLALKGGCSVPRLIGFGVPVAIAAGLKFYPAVAVLALLPVLPWKPRVLGFTAMACAVVAVLLGVQHDLMARATWTLPPTLHEFGAALLWRDLEPNRALLAALTFVVLSVAGLTCRRFRFTVGLGKGADPAAVDEEALLFALGSVLLLGCFLTGTSFSYRLVFLLFLWPWLARRARAGESAARLALVLVFVTAWSDGLCCAVVNYGHLSYRPELGWRVATQLPVWALMALAAGWLWDGFLARFADWRAGISPVRR